ncbi:unnamed protein product [Darwinula stevensoni]|uniref:Cytochrome b561 domain-containing protein n=1 Tax=Darwinula stevensoni TaxID=69355 RepID=A0A7R9A3S6_9CRUS|nr:unnamed protein product [Darwinula stevensoni]CAG0892215.1 unnamed protein product [Darwinula stevensoni]
MAVCCSHGALMLAAWVGCAAPGLLIATFYRKAFPKFKVFDKDFWFAAHWSLMVLTAIFTLAGSVVIYDLEKWKQDDDPHSVLGLFVCLLASVQPLMGVFRPRPTHKWRPAFNWVHWAVGHVVILLACEVMAGEVDDKKESVDFNCFLAFGMKKIAQPVQDYYLMGFYVFFYFFVYVSLQKLEKQASSAAGVPTNQVVPVMTLTRRWRSMDNLQPRGKSQEETAKKLILIVSLATSWTVVICLSLMVTHRWPMFHEDDDRGSEGGKILPPIK